MNDDETTPFEIEFTDEAFYAYVSLPTERLFNHVDHDIELLSTCPELGQMYDPAYDALRPHFACRVFFCEHFGIYYRVDDAARKVVVFALEDQRRNPLDRFASFEYAVVPLDNPDAY